MATEVELPQLGESVTEGVITAWLVEVGDTVDVDQPIVEISTDKVDTEIPSPVAGVVEELKASVDDTIEVGQVIAVVGEGNGEAAAPAAEETAEADAGTAEPEAEPEAEQAEAEEAEPEQPAAAEKEPAAPARSEGDGQVAGEKALASPLVRKMLRDAGISTTDVRGSGPGGRITREDAERAIALGSALVIGGWRNTFRSLSCSVSTKPAVSGTARSRRS